MFLKKLTTVTNMKLNINSMLVVFKGPKAEKDYDMKIKNILDNFYNALRHLIE